MAWASVVLLVMLLALLGEAAYGVALVNGLVQVKHQVDQAWSNIDVLLKQRHDELPKLVDAVKGCMCHEGALIESVTALSRQLRGRRAWRSNNRCRKAWPVCSRWPKATPRCAPAAST